MNLKNVPSNIESERVLWRMRGPRRTIAAHLLRRLHGYELVVFFEDGQKDVIESQFDPSAAQALEDRATTLKQILRQKGLKSIEVGRPALEEARTS